MSIREVFEHWPREDLANLSEMMGLQSVGTPDDLEQAFKWAYHSKVRATVEGRTKRWLSSLRNARGPDGACDPQAEREAPSYDDVLRGAAKRLKVLRENAPTSRQEAYLIDAVLVAALSKMDPEGRRAFFEQPIDLGTLSNSAGGLDSRLYGPATTLVALSAAQASGFGVYFAATSALGFMTHAVGVTLPFAAYTGLSTTIAVIIGPAGFLAAGIWGAWSMTNPEWKKLTRAVVYIIATDARLALKAVKL